MDVEQVVLYPGVVPNVKSIPHCVICHAPAWDDCDICHSPICWDHNEGDSYYRVCYDCLKMAEGVPKWRAI